MTTIKKGSKFENRVLFKYLDAQGGLMMLQNSNLQFTNAMRLDDPFDCHPGLTDLPEEDEMSWDKVSIRSLETYRYDHLRDKVWLCSLSRVNDSLLMWKSYGQYAGVCIGLNMEKADAYLSSVICADYVGTLMMDVEYEDEIKRPEYFRDARDYFAYQLSTKGKAWEYEQEVRLVLIEPVNSFARMTLPYKSDDEGGTIDMEDVKAFPKLGGECFESLYLGLRIDPEEKALLIKAARELNPDIMIFQMTIDPDAFRLKATLLTD